MRRRRHIYAFRLRTSLLVIAKSKKAASHSANLNYVPHLRRGQLTHRVGFRYAQLVPGGLLTREQNMPWYVVSQQVMTFLDKIPQQFLLHK